MVINSVQIISYFALLVATCAIPSVPQVRWEPQSSGTTANLRGVSTVSASVAWASGSGGTCLRTTNGGLTWNAVKVPGGETLDFRDVEAFDASTAYLLSIGEGENSRIYKTIDGGKQWTLQFTNRDPKAFFDAMAFWDAANGIAVSDPVEGRFVIIKTTDGGATWNRVKAENIPASVTGEAAFAASGTCISVYGKNNVWIGTGGAVARVFRSTDRGVTWNVSPAPIRSGSSSSGIFSVAFNDTNRGVIVGGDYRDEQDADDNAAVTTDGGRTWRGPTGRGPSGFRSAVARASQNAIVAVGPSGSDYSIDGGSNWVSFGAEGYHAVSFARSLEAGWAVGAGGRIGKYIHR